MSTNKLSLSDAYVTVSKEKKNYGIIDILKSSQKLMEGKVSNIGEEIARNYFSYVSCLDFLNVW